MDDLRNRTMIIGSFLAACALSCAVASDERPRRGAPIESYETANSKFKIRITSYDELGAYLRGTYYVFATSQIGSDAWAEFMTVRHDDRPDIPQEQVRFVSDEIGYVFMAWKYAVTLDGGRTWSVWDAQNDLPNWQCCNHSLILDVRIGTDGLGTMKLNLIPERDGGSAAFQTKDYGLHWTSDRK